MRQPLPTHLPWSSLQVLIAHDTVTYTFFYFFISFSAWTHNLAVHGKVQPQSNFKYERKDIYQDLSQLSYTVTFNLQCPKALVHLYIQDGGDLSRLITIFVYTAFINQQCPKSVRSSLHLRERLTDLSRLSFTAFITQQCPVSCSLSRTLYLRGEIYQDSFSSFLVYSSRRSVSSPYTGFIKIKLHSSPRKKSSEWPKALNQWRPPMTSWSSD